MAYWFNVKTRQVETDENRSRDEDVMGPYATESEARAALTTAQARTQAWDEEDERREDEDGHRPNALGL
ncbi:methionine aminopeptidase [Arsenicicoccus dermatophilus]|uniref:methionine aminopeptidase n=1 Tax=Arsenicicoccus dermatophilus TaxID=1076331 RepID=UPI003916CF25